MDNYRITMCMNAKTRKHYVEVYDLTSELVFKGPQRVTMRAARKAAIERLGQIYNEVRNLAA